MPGVQRSEIFSVAQGNIKQIFLFIDYKTGIKGGVLKNFYLILYLYMCVSTDIHDHLVKLAGCSCIKQAT